MHRDVKPSNVILGRGGAKIIDFGVAHASDLSQLTATGMNIGTPSYMAPEQAKSGEVSPASDVYSLGVLLYFAATGRLPFGEGGTAEVLFRVVYEEPDVSGLNAVDPHLRDLVLRCMAKNPLQRPNAAGIVAMTQSAAGAGAWSPDEVAVWPEALAARISERTLAAGRTLPDPSLNRERNPTSHAPTSAGRTRRGVAVGASPRCRPRLHADRQQLIRRCGQRCGRADRKAERRGGCSRAVCRRGAGLGVAAYAVGAAARAVRGSPRRAPSADGGASSTTARPGAVIPGSAGSSSARPPPLPRRAPRRAQPQGPVARFRHHRRRGRRHSLAARPDGSRPAPARSARPHVHPGRCLGVTGSATAASRSLWPATAA